MGAAEGEARTVGGTHGACAPAAHSRVTARPRPHASPGEGQGQAWPYSSLLSSSSRMGLLQAPWRARGFLGAPGAAPAPRQRGPVVRPPSTCRTLRLPAPRPMEGPAVTAHGPGGFSHDDDNMSRGARGDAEHVGGNHRQEKPSRRNRLKGDASWSWGPFTGAGTGRDSTRSRHIRDATLTATESVSSMGGVGGGWKQTWGCPLTLLLPDGGLQTERGA